MRRFCLIAIGGVIGVALGASDTAWYWHRPAAIVPVDLIRADGNFCFAQWSEESGLRDADPESVFAVIGGSVQARFTFVSSKHQIIDSVGVFDSAGRAWFDIDLANRRYDVHAYGASGPGQGVVPSVTYMDTDSDLILDQKKDWISGALYCVDKTPTWHPCGAANETGAASP